MKEQSARSDLGRANTKQHMIKNTGYTWWTTKLRPECLKCKASTDGITEDEANNNHMEPRNARDVQRARNWKKTAESQEMN